MSQEQAAFSFDLNESLFFRQGQEVGEMVSISLEPLITIYPHEDYIQLRGVIELRGEYKKEANGRASFIPLEEDELKAVRQIEEVREITENELAFSHHFPIEISIPSERVEDLEEIKVNVSTFDYVFPSNDQVNLQATVEIHGIQPEEERVEPDVDQLDLPFPFFGADEAGADALETLMGKLAQFDDQLPQQNEIFSFEVIPEEENEVELETKAVFNREHEKPVEPIQQTERVEEPVEPLRQTEQIEESAPIKENVTEQKRNETAIISDSVKEQSLDKEEDIHLESEVKSEADIELESEVKSEADTNKVSDREIKEATVSCEAERVGKNKSSEFGSVCQIGDNQHHAEAKSSSEEIQEDETREEDSIPTSTVTHDETDSPAFSNGAHRETEETNVKAQAEPVTENSVVEDKVETARAEKSNKEEVNDSLEETPRAENDVSIEAEKSEQITEPAVTERRPQRAETGIHAQRPDEEGADIGNLTDLFGNETEESYTSMRLYIAQDKDTIDLIAKRYDLPVSKLLQHNRLETENIGTGQLIYIPVQKETQA